jgi:hypothetical protein
MTASEFKKLWNMGEFDNWCDFDTGEIDKAPINNLTKTFLKIGFPKSAAPCLSFEWTIYKGKFCNIADAYPEWADHNSAKNHWIIGSDGAGNPICVDVSENDKITLHDHEQRFEIIEVINSSISELAECLLIYRNFISKIQKEYGEDAFLESSFSRSDLSDLKNNLLKVNNNIFKESAFWRTEINCLEDEIA